MHNHPILMNILIGLAALAGGWPIAIMIGALFGALSGSVVVGAVVFVVSLVPCAVFVVRSTERHRKWRHDLWKKSSRGN